MSLIILNTVNALVQSMLFSLFFVNTVRMKYSRIRTFLILASAIVLTAVITLPVGRFVPVKAAVMLSVTIAAVFRVSDNTRREKIEICGAFLFILIVSELLSLQFYRVLSTDGDIRLYELTDTKIVCGIFSASFFSALP